MIIEKCCRAVWGGGREGLGGWESVMGSRPSDVKVDSVSNLAAATYPLYDHSQVIEHLLSLSLLLCKTELSQNCYEI